MSGWNAAPPPELAGTILIDQSGIRSSLVLLFGFGNLDPNDAHWHFRRSAKRSGIRSTEQPYIGKRTPASNLPCVAARISAKLLAVKDKSFFIELSNGR